MLFTNVSFGIFAMLPLGWMLIVFFILLECVLMSKSLNRSWFNKKIVGTTILSNLTSGIIGILTTMIINVSWILVIIIFHEVNYEINISSSEELHGLIKFYLVSFVFSIFIELLVNWLLLRKQHETKQIVISTIIANTVSYLIGVIALFYMLSDYTPPSLIF